MTKTKKVVAVMLAFLMIFSSASVLASAWDASVDDGSTLEISTKFFKEVDGQWVETEKVRPGDTVQARVYLGTDYYSNGSTLLFFYDKDFFTHSYGTSGPTALEVNTEAGSFAAENNVSGKFAADYDMSKKAADNGVDSTFLSECSAMYVTLLVGNGESNVKFDDSTWLFKFTFTVVGDEDGKGDLFVKESTIQSTSAENALVNVPKGPSNGSALDVWPMFLWDATPVLSSQPVSTVSSVTFNANGGAFENGEDTTIISGGIDSEIDASQITAPTMDGYSFMGWIDAADETPTYEEIVAVPATIPENDLVLNAYWMKNITISFDTDGGSDIASLENVTPYADFAEIAAPTKTGYTFVGWDVRGNMSLPEKYPAESTTYKAIWALNVEVSFNTDGGSVIDPISGVEGEPFDASAVADPTKDGYNFIMWSPELPEVFPTEDTTYNAVFESKTYRIWYYAVNEDGKTEASAVVQREYGSSIPTEILTLKLPEGKKFTSDTWYTDAACTTPLASDAVVKDNMKLYKKTAYASYNAIFVVDDIEYAKVSTVYGSEIVKPDDPAKEGYVFDGWTPDATVLGEPNDMTFYATWREAVNEAIYVVDGAQYEVYSVETGESLDVPADPYKEGYTFIGWTDVNGSTEPITLPATMPTSTVTYYAIFEINTYTLSFDTDGGSDVNDITQEYNTAVTAPDAPSKTGYSFKGWALSAGATADDAVDLPAKMPAENRKYYAIWEINKYTITFVDTGDVAYEAITQDYNTEISPVADPEKTGYKFLGWDVTIPSNMPAENMTITATWEALPYDAVFNADGGVFAENSSDTYTVSTKYNEDIVAPANPTKTGYDFAGWNPTVGKMDDVNGKSFTALWNAKGDTAYTVNVYTMKTDGEYGEADVKNFTATTDTTVTYTPVIPEGFELNASSVLEGNVAADGSLVLNVYIDRTKYDFTVKVDDDETTKSYYYGAAVTEPETPVKEGYTFEKWVDEAGKDASVPSAMPAGNVKIVAKWTINSHNVVWTIDGDETTQSYDYAETIVAPEASKTGYKFIGWTPEFTEGTTMPDRDLAFTAVFEAEKYDATFLADGGVFAENGTDTYVVSTAFDSEIVAPANPTKTGYVFSGWTPSTGMDIMDTVGGETYTATWSNASDTPYKVNVYTMGTDGEYGAADVKNFTGETNSTAEYTPQITDGFVLNDDKSTVSGTIAADGSLVLNVYIDRISYTFKAVSNGETVEEKTYLYGASIADVADPDNKVGYSFVSWNPEIPSTMPANDVTVEAVFEANTDTEYKVVVNYTDIVAGAKSVEYIYNGTSDNAIAIVEAIPDPAADNTEYVLLSDMAISGYSLNADAENQLTGTVAADGSTVLNIYYVANKYNVTYDANGGLFEDGNSENVKVLDYNASTVDNAPTVTREGYTFDGWNGPARVPANNAAKMTARWIAKSYTITWVLDGTETEETYDCDETIVKKTAPTKVGYTFDKWVDENGAEIEIPDTMPAKNLVIKTTYTINSHTVTWVDGDTSNTVDYNYNETIVVDTPSKEGYTFDGWFDEDGKQPSDYETVPDKDLVFTAKWTVNQYTITFENTGDSTIAPIKQDYNTDIKAPANPTRTGYDFDGWDTEIPAKMPATNVTITAKWKIKQYTINFVSDGGTDVEPITADYLSEVNAPTAPTKDGYDFGGWATTKGVTDESQAVAFPVNMPLDGTTYYAIWLVKSYTINFDTLGGTPSVSPVTADYLAEVAKPAVEPTREGYSFGGWSEVSGSTTAVKFPYTMPLNGTTLYAIWNIESYKVVWDNDGSKTTETYEYSQTINLPEAPSKTGYTFGGWSGYTEGMTMPAHDVTFTATWTANSYKATFNANGGAFSNGELSKSIDVAFDSDIVFNEVPVRAGYTFNGWNPTVGKMDDINGKTFEATWYADSDITYTIETYIMGTDGQYGEPTIDRKVGTTDAPVSVTPEAKEGFTLDSDNSVLEGVVAADGTTKLVVKYIRNQYDFTVNVDGSKTTNAYYYGATVAEPTKPVKEGYTFDKWNPSVPSTMPSSDYTVEATWTINKHDVIYMVDGVEYDRTKSVEYGTEVTPIAEPTKQGYTFGGWDKTEKFTMPDADVTISGTFTANDYTITFITDGGTEIEPIVQAYGSAITAPDAPTKSGYSFDGWYDGEGNKVGVPATMPLNGITLTAKWTPNQYTVTYYLDSTKTTTVYTTTASYLQEYNVPTAEKTGHSFIEWVNAETGESAGLTAGGLTTIPVDGGEYYATWNVLSYKLVYRANNGTFSDGQPTKEFNVPFGTAKEDMPAPDSEPTREGYTYGGWSQALPDTMPAQQVNMVAKWTIETYTVIWDNDGDITTETYEYGSELSIPELEKTGYTFGGWSGLEDGSTTMKDIGNNGDSVTYTAIWTANTYDAVFNANNGAFEDGESSKTIEVAFDSDIVFTEEPTRAGYTFGGWNPAVGKMDEEGKTFTAIWIADGDIAYTIETYVMGTDGSYGAPSIANKSGATDSSVSITPEAKEGFTVDTENSVLEGTIAADGTTTLIVKYIRNQYTLKTVVDGEETSSNTYYYDAAVSIETPSKTGYTFSGWDQSITKMPANDVTLSGSFTVNRYDVIYMVDGVEYDRTYDVAYGTPVTAIDAPTREGYTFSGWDRESFTMPDEEVVIRGTFTVNTYDVIYMIDGIEYDRVEDVAYGTFVTVMDEPTKTGYTFSGWNAEGFAMPDEEVTISGSWTAIDYTVTWKDGIDSTEDQVDTYHYEDTIVAPANPERAGYTFAGWVDEDGNAYAAGAKMPAESVVYTAKWTANDGVAYTVKTFKMNLDGTTYAESSETLYGTTGNEAVASTPAIEGFTYNAEKSTISGTIAGDGSLVLEVYYDRNKVSVDVNGDKDDYFYEEEIPEPEIPEDPNGGEFDGWEDEDGDPVDFPYVVPDEEDKEITITPVYNYTVKFYADAAMTDEVFAVKDRAGTTYTVPDATKVGYTFGGWTLNGVDAGLTVGENGAIPVGGATYIAKWNANDGIAYTVKTFKMNLDGTTYAETSETLYGKAGEEAVASTPAVEGFTFNAEKSTISGTIAGDGSLVLEVYYDRNKITVDVNGDSDEYFYGETIEEPEQPVPPEGNEFTGWEDEDGNSVDFPFVVPDEEDKEITITPVFTPIDYKATFVFDGGSTEEKIIAYGSEIVAPEAPAKEGYKFIKWVDENGKTPADYGTMPATDLTFTALYEVSAYQVYYWVNGKNVAVKSAEYGETIVTGVNAETNKVSILTYATPNGYKFDGWYTDADMTQKLAAGTTVGAARIDLYASETAGTYNAIFNVDGVEYEVVPTVFGEEIVLPDEPTKEGYTFTGWEPAVTVMDEEGKTFEATWTETEGAYTATYIVDDAEYEKFAMAYGDEMEVPADPYKEGFTFVGWTNVENGTEAITLPATMPAQNLTYYAIFSVNSFTVNFNNNIALDESPFKSDETEVYSTAKYDFDELIVMPDDPTTIESDYYTFKGWTDVKGSQDVKYTKDSELKMPASDLELYAVYERVSVKLVPVVGSTTVIERNGVTESYNDNSVTTDSYAKPTNYNQYYIYGFANRRALPTEDNLTTRYITYTGDGRIEITRREGMESAQKLGTGTKVKLYDNITGEVVEEFYIIYFGDVDGDCYVTADDYNMVNSEVSTGRTWSSLRGSSRLLYMIKAANLDGSANIYAEDLNVLSNAVNGVATIDQKTGTVS